MTAADEYRQTAQRGGVGGAAAIPVETGSLDRLGQNSCSCKACWWRSWCAAQSLSRQARSVVCRSGLAELDAVFGANLGNARNHGVTLAPGATPTFLEFSGHSDKAVSIGSAFVFLPGRSAERKARTNLSRLEEEVPVCASGVHPPGAESDWQDHMTQPDAHASGTFSIGGDGSVTRLGFGAMRITGPGIWGAPKDPGEVRRVLSVCLTSASISSTPQTATGPLSVKI